MAEHHRFIVGLIEEGALDWRSIDAWLRRTTEKSW